MLKFLYSLILIAGLFIIYNFFNPPSPIISLNIPTHALVRLGHDEGSPNIKSDLFFMLSADNSCKKELSSHNYIDMFRPYNNWSNDRLWRQLVVLYPTWQDIWQLTDNAHLCIRFKDKWEPVWQGKLTLRGSFNLNLTHKEFYCNKENSKSKWECMDYFLYYDGYREEEKSKLLKKYNENSKPNNAFNPDANKDSRPLT